MSAPLSRIVRPEVVNVRTVWRSEPADFTPWLAQNLDWLEDLGLGPLTCIATEVVIPGTGRALDILAETGDGRRVAIENQYSRIDHDHLTRGLAYAVGHSARALVVIAEDHPQEFVAVADYLNSAQEALGEDEGIAVFLIKLGVEQIGQHYVPRFEILTRPNEWLRKTYASQPPVLGTVDGFLTASDPRVAARNKAIVDHWLKRPGASVDTRASQSAALSIPHPYKPGNPRNSIYILYVDGVLWVYRGYYRDSGAFDSDEQGEQLDSMIRKHFPEAVWAGKHYYLKVVDPDPAQVAAFADWLLGYFREQVVARRRAVEPEGD